MRGKITAEGKLLDYEPKREKKRTQKEGEREEKGEEKSVWYTLAEHLLSLQAIAHPGGNESFLLNHETEQHCPENVSMAANAFLLCQLHAVEV